jgi:hypothetical protein
MTRTKAAAATTGLALGCGAWAWCYDRWPTSTLAATYLAMIYAKFRTLGEPSG